MTESRTSGLAGSLRAAVPLLGLLPALLAPAGSPAAGAASHRVGVSNQAWGEGKVFKPKFEDLVRHADLILLGRVVQVGRIAKPGPSKQRPRSKRYPYWEDSFAILQVEETIKGKAPRNAVKIAFHSDLEGDLTRYQAGKRFLVFLLNPSKYPDACTTAHFHFGEYMINDRGKAERVADASEISKPVDVLVANVRKVLGSRGRSR